jgi:hypothetical protein
MLGVVVVSTAAEDTRSHRALLRSCSAGILPTIARAILPSPVGRDAPTTAAGTAALRLEPHCYLAADLQVLPRCFTLSTLRVCCEPAALPAAAPELGLLPAEPEVVPLIWTSCPTCSVSFEVSP